MIAVVLALNALLVVVLGATGAWLLVGRLRVPDLSVGAAMGVGAYAVVASVLAGAGPWVGVVVGAMAGAVVSASATVLGVRLGRVAVALATLAVTVGVVAAARGASGFGGVAGFHAVPLLTGSDAGDLVVLALATVAAVVAAAAGSGSVVAAGTSVALHHPDLATSLGRRPFRDAILTGALAGALLGLAGALGATAGGSVSPQAYGLELAATLAIAALVGDALVARIPRAPRGLAGVVGALVVWGPSIAFPGAPVLREPPLLVVGSVALVIGALRFVERRPATRVGVMPPDAAPPGPAVTPTALVVKDVGLPAGALSFTAAPGTIVAVVGPNGSGKSTLLAQISGVLPTTGRIQWGPELGLAGAAGRARDGLARTWQTPRPVERSDVERLVLRDAAARDAAAWAASIAGLDPQLVLLAAQRPALALLDEPAATSSPESLANILRGLAEGGAVVIVAEPDRGNVVVADEVVEVAP